LYDTNTLPLHATLKKHFFPFACSVCAAKKYISVLLLLLQLLLLVAGHKHAATRAVFLR
jgi:hypothetical protein